jgi:hypothetical protein
MAAKKKSAIEEIVERSGNGFHSRVTNLLRELGWAVVVSPYYNDAFTDKPREIDIIAEKKFEVKDHYRWLGTIDVRLFVECKYITGKTVFWFDKKDIPSATKRAMRDTGMGDPRENATILQHRFVADVPVAKLSASEKSRGDDNDPINKAIGQCLNALIYYRNRHDLIPRDPHSRQQSLRHIVYPFIVVNSFEHFYRTSVVSPDTKPELITQPFQLEVNYAYTDKNGDSKTEYFLIDVVSIDKLPDFLSTLDKSDVSTLADHLHFQHSVQRRDTGGHGDIESFFG